jgi:hypothetical protein
MTRIPTSRLRPKNKYGNRKKQIDGYTFDSTKEANRYMELKFLLATGKIKDLELQKPFVLQESFRGRDGKWVRDIRYIADFYYFDTEKDEWVIEDVKSSATKDNAVYKLKKKMMAYKGLYITEV